MTDSISTQAYYLFHPWSEEVPEPNRCSYWIAFIAIAILTICIVPLIYYMIEALASLCTEYCCPMYTSLEPEELVESDCCSTALGSHTLSNSAHPTPTHARPANTAQGHHVGQRSVQNKHKNRGPKTQSLYEILKREIALTKNVERGPTNPGWLQFESGDQSFENFAAHLGTPDHKPLYIQLIGNFSEKDLQIVHLTMDFLKAFHRIDVHLVNRVITMNELKDSSHVAIAEKRRNWGRKHVTQYLANHALDALNIIKKNNIPEDSHYIAFTSEFLYSTGCENFVFGLGQYGGPGIFSNFLFGNPENEFRNVTARMMKIAAHEFGHMLCIGHCGKHECNIGGYMSLAELDSRPFYYCSKDTAKLCLKKGITLKEYYTDLLAFFLKFNEKHTTNFFDRDIKHVKKKLNILNAN